jgi:anti-sigma factor RsiW
MRHANDHVSDEEILMALDGELSVQRTDQVRTHVARCSACRARMEAIEGAGADFNRIYRATESASVPHASSRASLQRKLVSLTNDAAGPSRLERWVNPLSAPVWAYVCAAALLLLVLTIGWMHRPDAQREATLVTLPYSNASGPVLPDVRLTPGATRPVTGSEICAAGGPAEMRPPRPVQQAVFHEYGMDTAPEREYEVDHLITPALGGTDDIRNLWPEPYASTEWNAHVKDQLEDHLHSLVCGGKLDLATAQHDMASNWISAYKKYFHSDRPLPHTSDLIEDQRYTPKS